MVDFHEIAKDLPLAEALSIMRLSDTPTESINPELIFNNFNVALNIRPKDGPLVVAAKCVVMRENVSNQMERQRYFEIVSPFEHSCIFCRGTGELYKFNRKPVEVNCHICAGKKKLSVQCRSCKGSGRYIRRDPKGGGINVECRTCKGTGKVRAKCSHCFGKGKIRKIVPDHTMKSTTPCKHCDGFGDLKLAAVAKKIAAEEDKKAAQKQRKEKPIGNTVISAEEAITLSNMILND